MKKTFSMNMKIFNKIFILFNFTFLFSFGGMALSHLSQASTCTVGSGYATIQDALDNSSCTTVQIPDGTYNENLTINRDVSVEGTSREGTVVDAESKGPVLVIGSDNTTDYYDITIKNMTFQNGYNTGNGGGIENYQGYGTFENLLIQNNSSDGNGGGFYNDRSIVELIDVQFFYNTAKENGGGMYDVNNNTSITYSIFYSNEATDGGGGGYCGNGTYYIYNSIFAQNSAKKSGGGIYSVSDPLLMNVTITENSTDSSTNSGGVYVEDGLSLVNTIIAKNSGGDCYIYGATTSYGGNIDGDSTCDLTETTDQPSTDPKLREKRNHYYQPQHLSSPAIDKGIDSYAGSDDVVNNPRPVDGDGDGVATSDIGAMELRFSNILNSSILKLPVYVTELVKEFRSESQSKKIGDNLKLKESLQINLNLAH